MPTGKLREERTLNHRDENAELLDDFLKSLEAANRSRHTIIAYRHSVEDFLDFTLGLSVAETRHREITEWIHFLKTRGSKGSTISQRLYALRSFFDYATVAGVVKESPARLVQNHHVTRKLPRWLSIEDMHKLLAAAETPRDRALVYFFWSTGCRIAEVIGLRIENIDWNGRTARVIGKGDKERLVPLGVKTLESLKQYLLSDHRPTATSGPLFRADISQKGSVSLQRGRWWSVFYRETVTDARGKTRRVRRCKGLGAAATREEAEAAAHRMVAKLREESPETICHAFDPDKPLDQRSIRLVFRKLGVKTGIGRVHPHMFRHTFGTHLLEGGANLRAIQELLGHSSIATTQIYTHCSAKHLREALEKSHPSWQEERDENR